jgi:predicted Zn-dependent protease
MEREADAYALAWLNAACISPGRFADLLSRLDKDASNTSSHPGTWDRIRPFRSPGTCN